MSSLQCSALLKVSLLTLGAAALSGCVASMAASAIGMAVEGARGRPVSNEEMRPQARAACEAQAAPHGTVHIIDVQQKRIDQIIVWGIVE